MCYSSVVAAELSKAAGSGVGSSADSATISWAGSSATGIISIWVVVESPATCGSIFEDVEVARFGDDDISRFVTGWR